MSIPSYPYQILLQIPPVIMTITHITSLTRKKGEELPLYTPN